MNNSPEPSFDEQVEAIRQGKISNERLPDVIAQLEQVVVVPQDQVTKDDFAKHVEEIQKTLEARQQSDTIIESFAEERRKLIAEKGITSSLQRLVEMDRER